MVRRWSCINNINLNFKKFYNLRRKVAFLFCKTIIKFNRKVLRRLRKIKMNTKKITKFTRKALSKLKHENNWAIYSQIFKYWIVDYNFSKTFCRNQYLSYLFVTGVVSYNFSCLRNKKNKLYAKDCNYLSTSLTTRMNNFYFFKKFDTSVKLINNFFSNFSFFAPNNKNLQINKSFENELIPVCFFFWKSYVLY